MEQSKKIETRSLIEYIMVFSLFVLLTVWFMYIHTLNSDTNLTLRQVWGSVYQIVAIFGGITGLFVSRRWGGFKSLIGRAVFFLSLSLLLQSFGQCVGSYYNYINGSGVPYPSLSDLGFFGSNICYVISAWLLIKATGIHFSFKKTHVKLIVLIVPLFPLFFAYFFFPSGYVLDLTQPLKTFLDFGYPLCDAIYVSLAIIAFILCNNFLGGIMKKPVMFLICALIFQYVADFTFYYQSNNGSWSVAGLNDFLYFCSYFIMALGVIVFGDTFNRIKNSNN